MQAHLANHLSPAVAGTTELLEKDREHFLGGADRDNGFPLTRLEIKPWP